jgi:hypothetical protein
MLGGPDACAFGQFKCQDLARGDVPRVVGLGEFGYGQALVVQADRVIGLLDLGDLKVRRLAL